MKCFIGHTVHCQVDELKEANLLIDPMPDVELLVEKIIQKQNKDFKYDYASNEQREIDKLIYKAYGLSNADIDEIEMWYCRRYSKLAEAQGIMKHYHSK